VTDDDQQPIEDVTIPAEALRFAVLRPKPTDAALCIRNHEGRTLVTLRWNGAAEYDPADLDEAARLFWSAVSGAAVPALQGRESSGTRTPAQRGAANRRRGHDAERALARWLRSNGFGQAERAVRTGFRTADRAAPDPGDITGTPGIVWSVKDCAAEQTTKWLAELEVMRAGAGALVGLLVHRRRGYADPGRWWCWTPLDVPVWLLTGYGGAAGHAEARAPVRMELTDVVALLRATGYGDPPEATP
jgi:hypothetical protein